MLTFFIFLLFFGIGVNILNKAHLADLNSKCKVHKWVYTEQDTMVCEKCKKTPQETVL